MLEPLWKFLFERTPLAYPIAWSKRLILPGFDGFPLYEVLRFFFNGIGKGAIVMRASAVAFKFFLALFPAILFLFSLIPFIPVDGFQEELLLELQLLMPGDAYQLISETAEGIVVEERGALLSIGFLLTLYFATNGISALLRAFNLSPYVSHTRNYFIRRLLAAGVFVIIILLVLTGVGLILFGQYLMNYLIENVWDLGDAAAVIIQSSKWLVIIGLIYLAISILYTLGNSMKTRWKFFSAGSSLATVSVIILSLAFSYYVNHFGNYNKFYGSIGTLIVLMLWIYYNCIILLIGYDLNDSIQQAGKGVRTLPKRMVEQGERAR